MTIRLSDDAMFDALAAEKWLDSERAGSGGQFIALFTSALEKIAGQPLWYARTEDGPQQPETREYFIARFEYRVIYTIESDHDIEVLAVVHVRQRPGSWVRRLGERN